MMSKIFSGVLAVALLVPLHAGLATNPVWEAVSASETWDYGTHRVQKLSLPRVVEGPFNLGDAVVVQTVARSCVNATCQERDAYILRNGTSVRVPNVPKGALDLGRFHANGNRVAWTVRSMEDENRWRVVELDLLSGAKLTRTSEFFLDGVSKMDVMLAGDEIYLNPSFNYGGKQVFETANVYRYHPELRSADLVTKRYDHQNEALVDVDLINHRVLTKMTFESGEKELWISKTNSDRLSGEGNRVVGTWTPKHEDIVGAHFRPDGSVEYFRMYERYTSSTNRGIETGSTNPMGDKLNWYRQESESLFVSGDDLFWVDMEGELNVSSPTKGHVTVAPVASNAVRMNGDSLFYTSASGMGQVYNIKNGTSMSVSFTPVDRLGTAVVGTNAEGEVLFTDAKTNETVSLGFGSSTALSGDRYAYWRGADGGIYQASIAVNLTRADATHIAAVKTSGNGTVFLTDGVNRWTVPDEQTYFTWFDSWNKVQAVSPVVVANYRDQGPAKFGVGTRIKQIGDAQVYVIGRDGNVHWIVNEDVARLAYGTSWNKNILEVDAAVLNGYRIGKTLTSVNDFIGL